MANETGIYKLKDGGWGFRYTISVCEKRKDVKRVRDAYGNPMKTKPTLFPCTYIQKCQRSGRVGHRKSVV